MKAASAKEATQLSKDVRAVYSIKLGDVKKALTIKRQPTVQPEYLVLYVSGAVGLDKFSMSRRRVGVSVKVKSSRKVVKGGFVANVSGDKIFKRKGAARLPIERLYGPSVPGRMGGPKSRAT